MKLKSTLIGLSTAAIMSLTVVGCGGGSSDNGTPTPAPFVQVKDLPAAEKEAAIKAALTAYADYAIAGYEKALADAIAMRTAVKAFTDAPSASTLDTAKTAWITARESYGPTEIMRLSGGPIDGEDGFGATFGAPEGQLNAWPLDEAMIDYTKNADGTPLPITGGDIISGTGMFTPNQDPEADPGSAVDITNITKQTLMDLNENGGDANVASGYHAVEFLLWGQDQDYASFTTDGVTHGPDKAGARDFTDFTTAANADRRIDYINAAADLIVDDLESMVNAWKTGGYKSALIGEGPNAIAQDDALKQVMAGMAVFIKSELANERMAVAVLTPSEEDEHSCFSDNTHRDIALNYKGFTDALAIFAGNLSPKQKLANKALTDKIDSGVEKIDDEAKAGHSFDWQIHPSDTANVANIKATKNDMRDLGDEMINVAAEYGVTLSQDDVTDPDETTFP